MAPRSSRIACTLGAAGLVIASVLVTLVIFEIAMRWMDGILILSFPNFIAQQLDIIRANNGLMVYDSTLGWCLKENLAGGSPFTSGAYGLRMNSTVRRAPPQGAVLAVGDSFTAGSGVDDKDTWPAQLEKLISTPVLNAGVGAYGVDQTVLQAERLAPILHPRSIIVGILSQDILRDAYDLYGGGYKPWFRVENGSAVLEGVPVPHVASEPMSMDAVHEILGHSYLVNAFMMRLGYQQWWLANQFRYHRALSNEDAVTSVCALMDRVVQLGKTYNAHIIVVFFWGAGEVMTYPPAWFVTPVFRCARAKNLDVLDLYDVLRKIGTTDPDRFKTLWINEGGVLGHPSAAGNAITAQLLKERFFAASSQGNGEAAP